MSEFRLPSGEWRCTRDGVTEPCGECGGCCEVRGLNRLIQMTEGLGTAADRAAAIGAVLKAAADDK